MLGARYRFMIFNNSLISTGGAGTVTVKRKGWYINSSGAPVWEGSPVTIYSNTVAVGTGAYDSAGSTSVDNTSGTPLFGGEFEFTVNLPTGSPAGVVQLFLQRSVDGGTTWPDDGQGEACATLYFSTTGTQRTVFEYD